MLPISSQGEFEELAEVRFRARQIVATRRLADGAKPRVVIPLLLQKIPSEGAVADLIDDLSELSESKPCYARVSTGKYHRGGESP
jgi:hypothetical protein